MSVLIDSYSEANANTTVFLSSANFAQTGQVFTNAAVARYLQSVKFPLKKTGSPTGNAVAKLYAKTGTYGSDAAPTGSPLATSEVFNVASLTGTLQLIEFVFTGANMYLMAASTQYAISIEYGGGDSSNRVEAGTDTTSPSHGGNGFIGDGVGGWFGAPGNDNPFYLYAVKYDTAANVARSNALSSANTSMLATVNLAPTESLPGSTDIDYDLQSDSGTGFVAITKNVDTVLALPALSGNASHKWKATLSGSVTQSPILDGLNILYRKAMPIAATTDRLAQSFSSGAGGSITAVLLNLVKNISDTIDYTVEIHPDSSGSPSGTPITNGTATIAAASVPNQAGGGSFSWIAAIFSTPPTLSASTTYWIVIKIGSAGSSKLLWRARGGNSYGSGTAKFSTNSGSAYTTMTNDDFLFQVLAGGGTFDADVVTKYKRRYL